MNLHDLLSSPAVSRLGWTLLHSLWQVTAVAAVLWLVLAVLRRRSPQARYLAASLAMAAVLAMTVMTFLSVSPPAPQPPQISLQHGPPPAPGAHAPPPVPDPAAGLTASPVEASLPTPRALPKTAAVPWSDRIRRVVQPCVPWLAATWLLGVLLLSLWRAGGCVAACRFRTLGTRPLAADLDVMARRLAACLHLRRPVRVLQSVIAQTPLVIGWLRPVILLPVSVLAPVTGLTSAQLEGVLAHELAHIRRLDGLVHLLQVLLETLFFYHPALWSISHRMRIERERCCDDLAVAACGNRIGYVEALAALAQTHTPAPSFALASGLLGTSKRTAGRALLARIRCLLGLGEQIPRPRRLAGIAFLSALLLATLLPLAMVGGGAPPRSTAVGTRPNSQPSKAALATRKIKGRVVDADGRGVASAEILLLKLGPWYMGAEYPVRQKIVARTQSDADGEFLAVVTRSSEDPYLGAVARKRDVGFGYSHTVGYPATHGKRRTILLRKTATLEGVVVDEAGQPVADAEVRADLFGDAKCEGPTVLGCPNLDWFTVRTGKDGRFAIPGVPTSMMAEFIVRAAGRGTVATQRPPRAPQFRTGQKDIRIVLLPQCRLKGIVFDTATGERVAGVQLIGTHTDGSLDSVDPPAFAMSDKDGRFVMEALAPGRWTVALAGQRLVDSLDPGDWVARPVVVELAAGKSQSIRMGLSQGGTAEVTTVNAATGTPMRSVISVMGPSMLVTTALSDDKGVVRMRLLPGLYKLWAYDYPHPVVMQGQDAPLRYRAQMPLIVEGATSQLIQMQLTQTQPTQKDR